MIVLKWFKLTTTSHRIYKQTEYIKFVANAYWCFCCYVKIISLPEIWSLKTWYLLVHGIWQNSNKIKKWRWGILRLCIKITFLRKHKYYHKKKFTFLSVFFYFISSLHTVVHSHFIVLIPLFLAIDWSWMRSISSYSGHLKIYGDAHSCMNIHHKVASTQLITYS